LRVIVVMYMREARQEVPVSPVPIGLGAALAISVVATIYLGVLPGRVLNYANAAATQLVQSGPSQAARSAPSQ